MCVLCFSTKLAVCPVLPLMVLRFLRAAVVSSTGSAHHPRSRFAVSLTELEFSDAFQPIPTHKHTLYYSTAGKYDIKYRFWFPQQTCVSCGFSVPVCISVRCWPLVWARPLAWTSCFADPILFEHARLEEGWPNYSTELLRERQRKTSMNQ